MRRRRRQSRLEIIIIIITFLRACRPTAVRDTSAFGFCV